MLQRTRDHLTTVVIAFAVASVAAGGGALAASRSVGPVVKTKMVAGPVDVPQASGTIASLALPEGKWTVFARLTVATGDSLIDDAAGCELKLGARSNHGVGDINPPTLGDISLMVSNTLPSPGVVELQCFDGGFAAITAQDIVITAIKASKLTISTA